MFGKSALFLVIGALTLAACQNSSNNGDQTLNTPTGHAGTAVIHNKVTTANSPGILLSAWAGSAIGSFDSTDNFKDQQAEARAETAPIGQKITWNNPDSGHSGTLLPVSDGYSDSGAYCREFQQSVTIDGQPKQGRGKACQQPDGSWKIAS